jgi:hypothetical protein
MRFSFVQIDLGAAIHGKGFESVRSRNHVECAKWMQAISFLLLIVIYWQNEMKWNVFKELKTQHM